MRRQETMEKVTVTPQRAQQILDTIDLGTYRWRKNNYLRLLEDMREDRFDSEASIPLVLDFDGRAYNGRHRLAAQVEAGKTYKYWLHVCSSSLAQRIQTLGDAPAAWSTADELRSHGEVNTFVLSSALTYMSRYLNEGGIRSKQAPTSSKALSLLEYNKELREWVGLPATVANRWKISRAMCGWLAYTTFKMGVPEQDIKEFWATMQLVSSPDPIKVAEGVSRRGSEPISTFANWVRKSEPKPGQALRRSEAVVWAFLIMTWNAWVTSSKLTARTLKWDPEKDEFPAVCDITGRVIAAGSDEAKTLFTGEVAPAAPQS
jgi:hypothetical protein